MDTRQTEMKDFVELVDPISSEQIHEVVCILTYHMNASTDEKEIARIEAILEKFVLIDDKGTASILI